MYSDKADRKRRGGRDKARHDSRPSGQFPDLTDLEIQRAAAGVI